ncbi:abscisic acid receptor PYL8-like [Canna indica]|uniref:Abscisic acid receptor PYL8-like n=1 Tax=Canna indica TaxID=4628 RepID=A0AAQ3KVB6_9LILI|nr:abscisic acid receptor PYL8-like [Canna indica]
MVGISGTGVGAGRGTGLWRLADELHPSAGGYRAVAADYIRRFHRHEPAENQCSSAVFKHIKAPVNLVWSLVRRFDEPQKYKPFVSRCIAQGDLGIGSLREVNVKSGLPATTSTERLEHLDDNEHVLSFKIVGGDHRLKNYSSIVTAHPETIDGRPGTLVIESFVVDVPDVRSQSSSSHLEAEGRWCTDILFRRGFLYSRLMLPIGGVVGFVNLSLEVDPNAIVIHQWTVAFELILDVTAKCDRDSFLLHFALEKYTLLSLSFSWLA